MDVGERNLPSSALGALELVGIFSPCRNVSLLSWADATANAHFGENRCAIRKGHPAFTSGYCWSVTSKALALNVASRGAAVIRFRSVGSWGLLSVNLRPIIRR